MNLTTVRGFKMVLNEYSIVKGGCSVTNLDDEAQRYAKLFAESKGYNLQEKAVVTKTLVANYIHPIAELKRMDFRIDSSVRLNKNGDISVFCSLIDKTTTKVGVKAHITFAVIDRNSISDRMVGVTRKRKKSI